MKYSKQVINNLVREILAKDYNTQVAQDVFLRLMMQNDMKETMALNVMNPTLSDIRLQLLGNGIIDDNDIQLMMSKARKVPTQLLKVKISPFCTLYAETTRGGILQLNINDTAAATMTAVHINDEDVAKWIIRQKQQLDGYMKEWETVLSNASKKVKGNRLSLLAIKAIVTEAMKDYPTVKYEMIEQKRRMRIKVELPNSRLGVYIDAWWGSYKDRLPEQLESLKTLIEAHSKSTIKDFYISSR